MESWNIRMLRGQAWERAKGELKSMLITYGADDSHSSEQELEKYRTFKTLLNEFIDEVENNRLES